MSANARTTKLDASESSFNSASGGASRKLSGFTDDLQAKTAVFVTNPSDSVASATGKLAGSVGASTLFEATDSLLTNLSNQSTPKVDIKTKEATINLPWLQDINDFLNDEVLPPLGTIEGILGQVKSILEIIATLAASLDDILTVLINAILTKIEDLLKLLVLDEGVYLLPIAPIVPNPNMPLTGVDEALITSFASVAAGLKHGFSADASDVLIEEFEIDATSTKRSAGGLETLKSVMLESLDDGKDLSRPTGDDGMSAGLIFSAGGPTQSIVEIFNKICQMFMGDLYDKFFKTSLIKVPSTAVIKKAEYHGYDSATGHKISVAWGDPKAESTPPLLSVSKVVALTDELWTVQDTSILAKKLDRAAGFQSLDKFVNNDLNAENDHIQAEVVNYLTDYAESTFSGIELDLIAATENIKTGDLTNGGRLGTTWNFKLKRTYGLFIYDKGKGGYKFVGEDSIVYSPIKSVAIEGVPAPKTTGTGPAPNWMSYRIHIDPFVAVKDMLKEFLDYLRSFLSSSANYLKKIIDAFIQFIELIQYLVASLKNAIYLIQKLLNLDIGGYFSGFTADNGVSGIKQAIKDHFGDLTSKFDVNWDENTTVAGFILVGKSQKVETIKALLSFFELLIGGVDSKTTGERVDEEFPPAIPLTSFPIPAGFESAPAPTAVAGLLNSALGALTSDEYLDSPENLCEN